jgi:hypothetical protein
MVRLMFRVHTDSLAQQETGLLTKYLTPDQVDQKEVNAMKNIEASKRKEIELDLGLQIPVHISYQNVQELQCFKTNIGKNLDELTKSVYKG